MAYSMIGTVAALIGLMIGAYWLGRSYGNDECERLRQRGDEYRRKFLNATARLEREQYNNRVLNSRLVELETAGKEYERLENSVRKVTV